MDKKHEKEGKEQQKKTRPNLRVPASKEHIFLFLKQKVSISTFHIITISVGTMGFHYLTELSTMYFNILCSITKYSTEIIRSKKQLLYCSLQLFHCKIQLQGSNWQGQNYVAIRAWQQKQTRTENGFDTSGNKQVIITAAWKGHNQPNWHHPSHIIKCEIPLRAV